ncbi:hypothetical protein Pla123a_43370 [Posidoniimonas polymericola]|uniref:BioF2-like acetyltransferase domain-containing protein n=1 Tax=Posidoniimonas polymericola TaxID=2528002 RepID=A0A5C5XWM6_9BACT|nr:GNAT family N-acetyltransferase [Posidoniimonas polymericola]TWT66909.1 hypothetical protein Pla123a_43370 [Posidoniimonas polymericola]
MNANALQISTANPLDGSLRNIWNELAGAMLFRRYEWAESWLSTFGKECEPRVAVVRDSAGEVVGIAPFCLRRMTRATKALELIGGAKACGDELSLLVRPGLEPAVVEEIAGWLVADRAAGVWDELWLTGVDGGDQVIALLEQALSDAGAHMKPIEDQSRWVCPLPSCFEDYASSLGKSSRRLLRQALKKVDDPKQNNRLRFAEDETSRQEYLEIAEQLHEMRWQGLEGGGCFSHAHFRDFIDRVTREWLQEEKLHLAVLWIDEEPAAAAISAECGGTFSIYLTGRNPRFDDRHAGWMMNFSLVRRAIKNGAHTLDMLRGDEAYKQRLGARQAPQLIYYVSGRGVRNCVRGLSYTGREQMKKWTRQWSKTEVQD